MQFSDRKRIKNILFHLYECIRLERIHRIMYRSIPKPPMPPPRQSPGHLTFLKNIGHICHAGAVANVHFKLCRSSLDGHTIRRKVETSSSEAKIVRIGAESSKIFPSRAEKGTNGLSFFALEGKIEQRIRI